MMEPSTSAQQRSRWLRVASRLSGAIAVVLGGWSLWLAFSTEHKPEQMEALHEPDEAIFEPDLLTLEPERPVIQITNIEVSSETDPTTGLQAAAYVVPNSAEADPITMASFATESAAVPATSAAESAAWLTGEIEDGADETQPRSTTSGNIPMWKRTTKSLKTSKRAPPSIPR